MLSLKNFQFQVRYPSLQLYWWAETEKPFFMLYELGHCTLVVHHIFWQNESLLLLSIDTTEHKDANKRQCTTHTQCTTRRDRS